MQQTSVGFPFTRLQLVRRGSLVAVKVATLLGLLLAAVVFGVSGHAPGRPTSSGALGGPPVSSGS